MYAVIMAGGAGTRFWPLSRRLRPKQLLAIGSDKPMLVETIERLAPLVPPENVRVVAGPHLVAGIQAVLPTLGAGLIVEPAPRNTAPCVGLAAIHLLREDPGAVMAVLPADHHISNGEAFREALAAAAERAALGEIVTLGIRPTRPETGYGYIHADHTDTRVTRNGTEVCGVRRFVEKPPREVAERYLADGGYLWNSGMFFFTAARIMKDIQQFLPNLASALEDIEAAIGTDRYAEVLADRFASVRSVSIDYGVMEHAAGVRVIPADFGWNDVGHWAALADFAESDAHGNVVRGPAVVLDARDCIVHSEGRLTAVVGIDGLVVVATADAVLVCPRDHAQDVRKVVEALEAQGEEQLL